KGYPEGYRVLSNTLNTVKRIATTLHMDTNYTRLDFIKDIKRHITEVNYIKPEVVKDAPVLENVFEGKDIDMWKFPTPKWHELDGGRYRSAARCLGIRLGRRATRLSRARNHWRIYRSANSRDG